MVCSNHIVVPGINDVATTRPDLIRYFKNIADSKTITKASSKNIDFQCPICGYSCNKPMSLISGYGFKCPICSDKISYPEKFIASLLMQLNIYFECHVGKNLLGWCKRFLYDFYLPDYNMICETHGKQHYKDMHFFQTNLEERIKSDNDKKDLAIENGIKNYIVIDCRESSLKWIKNSIMNSELPMLLGFTESDINWNKCDTDTNKSILVEACNLWNTTELSLTGIAKKLKIGETTARRYLSTGLEQGLCNYDPKESLRRGNINKKISTDYTIKPVFYDEIIYSSCHELARILGFSPSGVKSWIKKEKKPKDKKYENMHYATEEEIATYPKYVADATY